MLTRVIWRGVVALLSCCGLSSRYWLSAGAHAFRQLFCFYVGSCAAIVFSYVFFFQAEDGIRDTSVTGVQTCALPILRPGGERPVRPRPVRDGSVLRAGRTRRTPADHDPAHRGEGSGAIQSLAGLPGREIGRASCRKECRSRWWQAEDRYKQMDENVSR